MDERECLDGSDDQQTGNCASSSHDVVMTLLSFLPSEWPFTIPEPPEPL